jgi:hypothetical protein
MKFFLPGANTPEMGEKEYQAIKSHLALELTAAFSERRIFLLNYVHNGKNFASVVGQVDSGGEGLVIAILYEPLRSLYHVCTPHRGIIRGMPILVGEHDVRQVVDFDA